jgi:hypothetical protein
MERAWGAHRADPAGQGAGRPGRGLAAKRVVRAGSVVKRRPVAGAVEASGAEGGVVAALAYERGTDTAVRQGRRTRCAARKRVQGSSRATQRHKAPSAASATQRHKALGLQGRHNDRHSEPRSGPRLALHGHGVEGVCARPPAPSTRPGNRCQQVHGGAGRVRAPRAPATRVAAATRRIMWGPCCQLGACWQCWRHKIRGRSLS